MAFFGTLIVLVVIVLGQLVAGGDPIDLFQIVGLVIVFGGSFGILIVGNRSEDLVEAVGLLKKVFFSSESSSNKIQTEIIEIAKLVRRDGLLVLDKKAAETDDPLLKRALLYITEGMESKDIRAILHEEEKSQVGKFDRGITVWEGAASVAPALGIVAAVIGLIPAVSAIDNPKILVDGMKGSLVSLVYGMVLANVFFSPWVQKLRTLTEFNFIRGKLIEEGVAGIQEGQSPAALDERLKAIVNYG